MTRHAAALSGAALFTTLLTAFVTWPQALHPAGTLVGHHDTYFSIWRIAWIAHALATVPGRLFDGNIFYPAAGTLTYSDATLLQGLIAAPMHWAGAPPALVYNILLAIGFAGSGLGMFVLARYLLGASAPALVSAAVFTMAPYRIEHIMHLELQWAMWIPLTFWALHRAVEESSRRLGALAGLFFGLQVISCVYYGVFLALALVVFVPILLLCSTSRAMRAVPALALAGAVALVITLPYAWPYIQTARTLGARDMRDIVQYSARPINYLAATSLSRLWGWTADRWGGPELRLFPGLVAIVLALGGFLSRSRRWVLLYAATTAVAVESSFGINSTIYHWLFDRVQLLQGLRSSARFAIIASCGVAMLAGLGAQAIALRARRASALVVPLVLGLVAVDSANRPLALTSSAVADSAPLYRVIRSAGPGVVIELPFPKLSSLPGWDAFYALWSLQHWHSLVNGYSGYYPPDYVRTSARMESFPDSRSIATLKAHDVRYIVVHRDFMEPGQYASLMLQMARRPEIRPWGTYRDPLGNAALFVLEQ